MTKKHARLNGHKNCLQGQGEGEGGRGRWEQTETLCKRFLGDYFTLCISTMSTLLGGCNNAFSIVDCFTHATNVANTALHMSHFITLLLVCTPTVT